jgi:hypothetical protein
VTPLPLTQLHPLPPSPQLLATPSGQHSNLLHPLPPFFPLTPVPCASTFQAPHPD